MGDEWMAATPPATLRLACGTEVPHAVGTRVFNYYDHKPGTVTKVATYAQPPTDGISDAAWWVGVRHDDGSTALLDQSRMCSLEHARRQGWAK